MWLLEVKFTVEARSLRHSELIVLLYKDIAHIIFFEMVTDNFADVHERVIQLLISMYLSLFFKCLLIQVSHKVVDTIIIVDEEETFELS